MKIKIGVVGVILLVIFIIIVTGRKTSSDNSVTTTVQRGDVTNTVSVSGFIEAKNTANLAFPVVGTVTDVFVKEGDIVQKGDLLATLGSSKLVAQRADAVGALQKARASQEELVAGPTQEARLVTQTTVSTAQESLNQTTKIEDEKVANARQALLSAGLEARSNNPEESSVAPTVTGVYTCQEEGTYELSVYTSGTLSGYSYTFKGLEVGTGVVTYNQPASLGSCGLSLQFTEGTSYANSKWEIEIPNTTGSSYVTYKNAYDLAIKQREKNIQTTTDTLSLAQKTQTFKNAAPRSTSLRQSDAAIYSAQARIAQIDAQIRDLSVIAPFSGMITNVDIVPGETVTSVPVLTLLASDSFELKARIPEIDITKITEGQTANIVFDAKTTEPTIGVVTFISPLATSIDGVAYFETTIQIAETPNWIKSGLNADIDILISTQTDVLRVPKRFITETEDNTYTVTISTDKGPEVTPVKISYKGNDGYWAVDGLSEGATLIAP